MIEKIKSILNEYLEFDSDKLFRHTTLIRIFGGAIRDIIANEPIRDVDILLGARSVQMVAFVLEMEGYFQMEGLCPKDLQGCYQDIRVINEPLTFVKGSKVVQLIKPATGNRKMFPSTTKGPNHSVLDSYYKQGFYNLISNVDISCCGVSYDGRNLYENTPFAITHCMNKIFLINKDALMYNESRIHHRVHKMIERGWDKFENNDLQMERDVKIKSLVDPDLQSVQFIKEYKSESMYGSGINNQDYIFDGDFFEF